MSHAHRRALSLLLSLVLLLLCPLSVHATPSSGEKEVQSPLLPLCQVGDVSAKSAILMDADSGQVLYQKNADERLPMASTTKIMTALCAVELAGLDKVIRVDARAVGIEGSSIYLQKGEQLTLLQLLYALLLQSANDAAAAIAIGTAGSIEAFAGKMNQKACDLGLENSHFDNPHGLDSEQHYTTAHDLALIARAAMANPTLRAICATRKITIPGAQEDRVRVLVNHNKLLRTYQGSIGVKTGFTKRSGRCLVSAAEREGLTLIAVTLSAPDDWNDHTRMLDAGFSAYEQVSLCGDEGFETLLPVMGGREQYVLVRNAANVSLTLPKERGALLCTVELPRFAYADVKAGDAVGRLLFCCDLDGDGEPEKLTEIPLTTTYAVPRRERPSLWKRIGTWLSDLLRKQ